MPWMSKIRWMTVPQRIGAIVWISFLMAGAATGVFFSVIDPLELQYCVSFPAVSRTAAYSIGFLLFWLLTSGASLLSVFFVYPPEPTPHD